MEGKDKQVKKSPVRFIVFSPLWLFRDWWNLTLTI